MTDPVHSVRLQPLVRARVAADGDAGAHWAAGLPRVVGELSRAWRITPVGPSLPGGSASYVTRVRRSDGSDAVLKVALDDGQLPRQVEVLRRADGRGYVRVLAYDAGARAVLLERLGPSLERSGWAPERQLAVLADLLRAAWLPPDRGPTDKAADLAAYVAATWEQLGRPGPVQVRDQALAYAEHLRVETSDPVVLHGDPHPGNALAADDRGGYRFVDPDGFVGDRAYDLGVAVRDWTRRLTRATAADDVRRWCVLLADRTGVDAERIRRWSFLQRVSTGLYVMSFGAERVGRPFLSSAEWLLDGS